MINVVTRSGLTTNYAKSYKNGGPGETRRHYLFGYRKVTPNPRQHRILRRKAESMPLCSQKQLKTFRDIIERVPVWKTVWSRTYGGYLYGRTNFHTENITENNIAGGLMDFIEVKIKHFSKYIKRGDIKTPNWFAVDHNILLHPDFFDVTGDEVKAYLWIVGTAAHLNSEQIRVYPDVCASQIRISKDSVQSCIEKLTEKRWDVTDTSRVCTGNSKAPCTTVHDSTVHDSEVQDTSRAHAPVTAHAARSNFFIAAYCERFKNRWGNNPPITGKDAGIAKRLAKQFTEEKLSLYLDAFFSMPDAWVLKAKHPLNLFETKLNEIVVFANSGQFTTARDVRDADETNAVAAQLKRIREGKV
jgi:hypothetical protein